MQKPAPGMGRRRLRIGAAVLAVLVAAAGAWFLFIRSPAEPEKHPIPPLLTFTEGDLLYVFHVPTGSEELFDVKTDPGRLENLARSRKEDATRLRKGLSQRLGVEDLEDLRKGPNPVSDALRGLGYM